MIVAGVSTLLIMGVIGVSTTAVEAVEDGGGPIGPMDGPNGGLSGGPIGLGAPYEPKSPTLRMISYDSYHPLSRV
jgi:hypothetical protein